MRILVSYIAVGRGGDAVQLMALIDVLREKGHEVFLAGAHPIAPYESETAGARIRDLIRRLPWWGRDLLELVLCLVSAWRAHRIGRRERVDLLVHRAGVYDFFAGYLAKSLRIPMVLHLDAHVSAERGFRGQSYWRSMHTWAMRTLGRSAVVIVTPSRSVADYYCGLGLPANKVVVQRNGVRERHLRMGLELTEAHLPFGNRETCTIGFVGSLARWHRLDTLLDALQLLNDRRRPARDGPMETDRRYRLVVIGRGEEYKNLREHARRIGLDEVVEWRGALSHDDAVQSMREFDIAVLPDTLTTGTPMKLQEYAAMGRPIIAPDLPNIRDMFTPGLEINLVRSGDAIALAQAIRMLAANVALAQHMGRAAQARASEHTWEAVADLLLRACGSQHSELSTVSDSVTLK